MLDADLAKLYEVTTSALNQAVKRNAERFPEDFAFQLSQQEFTALISQSVTSNAGRGGRRKRPCLVRLTQRRAYAKQRQEDSHSVSAPNPKCNKASEQVIEAHKCSVDTDEFFCERQ